MKDDDLTGEKKKGKIKKKWNPPFWPSVLEKKVKNDL